MIHFYFISIFLLAITACSRNSYLSSIDLPPVDPQITFHTPIRITVGNESNYAPALSPNGSFVFFTSNQTGNKDLFVKPVIGGYPTQLTFHPADDFSPAVSPNGKQLAFVSRRQDALGLIQVMDLSSNFRNALRRLDASVTTIFSKDMECRDPAWMPNSSDLIFSGRPLGSKDPLLFRVSVKDPKSIQSIFDLHGEHPNASSDGSKVVYSDKGQIRYVDLKTGQNIPLTSGKIYKDGHPRFTSKSDQIVFTRYADDSNEDGIIDMSDNPSVWILNIDQQLAQGEQLDNFAIRQLTSGSIPAFYPSFHAPVLTFASNQNETLDIYRVPEFGQSPPPSNIEEFSKVYESFTDLLDQTYFIRQSLSSAIGRKDMPYARWLLLRYLDHMIQSDRDQEVRYLVKIAEATLPSDVHFSAHLQLRSLESRIHPWLPPDASENLDNNAQMLLDKTLSDLESIKNQKELEDSVLVQALILEAKILAAYEKWDLANKNLNKIIKEYAKVPQALSSSLELQTIFGVTKGNYEVAIKSCSHLTQEPQVLNSTKKQTSQILLQALSRLAPSQPFSFKNILGRQDLSPYLRGQILERYAAQLDRQTQPQESIKIRKELLKLEDSDPESTKVAFEKILQQYESKTQISSAESLFTEDSARFKSSQDRRWIKLTESKYYLRLGTRRQQENDLDQAAIYFHKALSLDPENLGAKLGLLELSVQSDPKESSRRTSTLNSSKENASADDYYIDALYLFLEKTSGDSRSKSIDEAVRLMEKARELRGDQPHYHNLLGKLYLEKHQIVQKEFAPDTTKGRLNLAFAQTKEMLGFPIPNYMAQSIDSHLTAFQLFDGSDPKKSDAASQIADIYFKNQNYSLSLKYYLKRLSKLENESGLSNKEAIYLFRHAGRAAFFANELSLASTFQNRALLESRQSPNELDYRYSLDALALTARERLSFKEAENYYRKLVNEHLSKNDRENLILAQINLAYCLFMSEKYDDALNYYEQAEALLQSTEILSKNQSTKGIQIDLGGQGSASFGFGNADQKIQILTFKSRIYELKNDFLAASTALEKKLATLQDLFEHRSRISGIKNYLAEERAITRNNLGWLLEKQNRLKESRDQFLEARALVFSLRVKNQNYPSRPEWINLLDASRIDLQRSLSNSLPKEERDFIEEELKKSLQELEEGVRNKQKDAILASIGLKSVLAQLFLANTAPSADQIKKAQEHFKDSILLARSIDLGAKDIGNQTINLDLSYLDSQVELDDIFRSQAEYRRYAITAPQLTWKYLSSKGLFRNTIDVVAESVGNGSYLKSHDLSLIRKNMDDILLQDSTAPTRTEAEIKKSFEILAKFFYLKSQSKFNEQNKSTLASEKISNKFSSLERIQAALKPGESLLQVHKNSLSGKISFSLLQLNPNPVYLESLNASSLEEALAKTLVDSEAKSKKINHVYLVSSDFPTTLNLVTKLQTLTYQVSVIPSGHVLPMLQKARFVGVEPEIRSMKDFEPYLEREFLEKMNSEKFSPLFFTNETVSTPNALEAFLRNMPQRILDSFKVSFVYSGYFASESKSVLKENLDRSKRGVESLKNSSNFKFLKQNLLESIISSIQLDSTQDVLYLTTQALDLFEKNNDSALLEPLSKLQKEASTKSGQSLDMLSQLNRLGYAVDQKSWSRALNLYESLNTKLVLLRDKKYLAQFHLFAGQISALPLEKRMQYLELASSYYQKEQKRDLLLKSRSLFTELLEHEKDSIPHEQILKEIKELVVIATKANQPEDRIYFELKLLRFQLESGQKFSGSNIKSILFTSDQVIKTKDPKYLSDFLNIFCRISEVSDCSETIKLLDTQTQDVINRMEFRSFQKDLYAEKFSNLVRSNQKDAASHYLEKQILIASGKNPFLEINLRLLKSSYLRSLGQYSEANLDLTQSKKLLDEAKFSTDDPLRTALLLERIKNLIASKQLNLALNEIDQLLSSQSTDHDFKANLLLAKAEIQLLEGAPLKSKETLDQINLTQSTFQKKSLKLKKNLLLTLTIQESEDRLKKLHEFYENYKAVKIDFSAYFTSHLLLEATSEDVKGHLLKESASSLVRDQESLSKWFDLFHEDTLTSFPKKETISANLMPKEVFVTLKSVGPYFFASCLSKTEFHMVLMGSRDHASTRSIPDPCLTKIIASDLVSIFPDHEFKGYAYRNLILSNQGSILELNHRFLWTPDQIKLANLASQEKKLDPYAVIIPPSGDSFVKKTSGLLTRFFASPSFYSGNNKEDEKNFETTFPILIASLPDSDDLPSLQKTTTSSQKIKSLGSFLDFLKQNHLKISSDLLIFPQPVKDSKLVDQLHVTGSQTVLMNRGQSDKDADTFLLKRFFMELKDGKDVCQSLHLAKKYTQNLYPGPMGPSEFWLVGPCLKFL